MSTLIWTVIAAKGDWFTGFEPYVAAVNEAGTVAFQAALASGGSGVFAGDGGEVEAVAVPPEPAEVISHPDLNDARAACFYGEHEGGGAAVFLLRDGRMHAIADTLAGFAAIGPLGPTMNEAGAVGFRAERPPGVSGVFKGDADGVVAIADTDGEWSELDGLPVIVEDGTVVFRADRRDGVAGIYAGGDGPVRAVVETGGELETLARFPSAHGGTVAFAATLRAGGGGIFTVDGHGLTRVTDPDEPFESYRGAIVGGTSLAWIATPLGGTMGLYAGPEHERILGIGEPFRGSPVENFAANPVSMNAVGQLAVRVTLADGTQLILRADSGR